MPKVKLPSTKPTTKSGLSKKAPLTGVRCSPPANDALGDVNCADLLNDASEMLHRDDDMCAPFLGFKSEEVLLERKKLSLKLGYATEHKRKCETPLKSLTSLTSEVSRGSDDLVSSKKRRADGDDANGSRKGKGRKSIQDEPSFKRKKTIDELLTDNDESAADAITDNNAMQTRMRTGTISKSTLVHLSAAGDMEILSDNDSNASRPISPNWEEQEEDIVMTTKTPSRSSSGKLCKRRGRCMECPNCLKKDDCGQCANCLDKPKFGGPNTRKQACIHRKCYNLMIRHRKPADSSTPKQSKRQPRPPTDEAGPVQTRPHPSAMNKASLLHRKTNRRVKGKSAIQLRWQHISSDGMAVYWRRGQQSHVIPLCAHCGSGGMAELIRCQVCCVPYHWYCLKDYRRGDYFICASCIYCAVCGGGDHLWSCCKCKKYYHSECLTDQEIAPNRSNRLTWQCISCSKCCSCDNSCPADTYSHTPSIKNSASDTTIHETEINKENTYQFCSSCYKLFSEGNYCPICFVCYSDNDYDSKMVQCGKCDHWIHSHCESMTDEEYEVLSELPEDSVIFLCRLCSDDKGWREAILKHCNGVFQQIMENLQELSIAKVLFQTHLVERGGARSHGNDKGGATNNGYTSSQSSMILLTERVANGYYKTVESFSNGLLLAMMSLLHQQSDQLLYKTVINTWSHFIKLMQQHFAWYRVKDITNLSEVSCVLAKESYHDNSTTADDIDDGRQQWLATFPNEHNYYKKKLPVPEKSSCDLRCDDKTDLRKCLLCSKCGDHSEKSAGRLIPCGIGEWVHVNCALWSAEVYEEQSGMMYDVHTAISRGSRVRCDVCHELGATIGCCACRCNRSFHFLCALSAECLFLANKNLFCPEHSSSCEDQPKATEEQLQVTRCVVIDMLPERHYVRLVESIDPEQISTQIGCTLVHEAGEVIPQSETSTCLLPSKYRCSFQFWDVNNPVTMTTYTLTVKCNEEAPTVYLSSWTNPSQPPGGDADNPLIDYECVTVGGPSPELHPERLPVGINGVISQVDNQMQQLLEAQLVGGAVEGLMSLAGECNMLDQIKEFHMPNITPSLAGVNATQCDIVATPTVELASPCLERLKMQKPATPSVLELHLTSSSGLSIYGSSVQELWDELISKLQQERLNIGLERLHLDNISPFKLFGLSLEPVVRIIEQLPDTENCTLYQFKHHPPSKLSSWYDARKRETINQTGCARSEPYRGRQPWDMFNFLMSEYRPKPPEVNHEDLALAEQEGLITHKQVYSAASTLPMAMRYRNLRKKVKQTVGVYKSSIHGMGLFCKQSIDPAEMVIEYAGTVIRSALTDKREKYYNSKNIGCYMFRIDEHEVVDATMSGNAARFINHSCEPNCYSKIITVDGRKKIIIFARRRIVPGEELTYDYKFPIEDASAKIPCNCGAPHCRGTMN